MFVVRTGSDVGCLWCVAQEEEEEEQESILEQVDSFLRKIPMCGADIANLIPQD